MPLPDDIPVSESLAVFLGVTGFQWLTEGRAGLLLPFFLAALSGCIILAIRRHRKRRDRELR